MSAPARLGAFAATLGVVFGASFAVGRATGPDDTTDVPPPASTTTGTATTGTTIAAGTTMHPHAPASS